MPHLQVSDIPLLLTSVLSRLSTPSLESPELFARFELLIHRVFQHLADLFFSAFLRAFLAHSDFERQVVQAKLASDKHLRNRVKRTVTIRLLGGHPLTLSTTVVSRHSAPKRGARGPKRRSRRGDAGHQFTPVLQVLGVREHLSSATWSGVALAVTACDDAPTGHHHAPESVWQVLEERERAGDAVREVVAQERAIRSAHRADAT